jgi:hypothetical protein
MPAASIRFFLRGPEVPGGRLAKVLERFLECGFFVVRHDVVSLRTASARGPRTARP